MKWEHSVYFSLWLKYFMILKTWEQKQLSVKEKKMFKEEKQREQNFTQEIYSPKFTVRNYFSRSKILQKEKKKCEYINIQWLIVNYNILIFSIIICESHFEDMKNDKSCIVRLQFFRLEYISKRQSKINKMFHHNSMPIVRPRSWPERVFC